MCNNWDLTQPQHNVTYEDTAEYQIDEASRNARLSELEERNRNDVQYSIEGH